MLTRKAFKAPQLIKLGCLLNIFSAGLMRIIIHQPSAQILSRGKIYNQFRIFKILKKVNINAVESFIYSMNHKGRYYYLGHFYYIL